MADDITSLTHEILTTKITSLFSALSSQFTSDDVDEAAYQAVRELGFSIPNSTPNQIYWLLERSKRHLIAKIWLSMSTKFQIKQYHLDQKFTNLGKIIDKMDKEWEDAKEQPDYGMSTTVTAAMFGHVVGSGFVYDPVTGEDISNEYDILLYPEVE